MNDDLVMETAVNWLKAGGIINDVHGGITLTPYGVRLATDRAEYVKVFRPLLMCAEEEANAHGLTLESGEGGCCPLPIGIWRVLIDNLLECDAGRELGSDAWYCPGKRERL
jgi:hypothetical protein